MAEVKIRTAEPPDFKSIIRIFKTEYSKPPYKEHWSTKLIRQRILQDFKNCGIFVLDIEKKVKGFLILGMRTWDLGKQGFIEEIVITAPFQGKGYGTKLLLFAEKWFTKKGAKSIVLITSPKAKAFQIYTKRFNYQEEGLVSMRKTIG